MNNLDFNQDARFTVHGIPSYVQPDELAELARLAADADGERILEIGSCYGASTATLALAAPRSTIYAIDAFLWSPIPEMPASASRLAGNLSAAGATNVCIIEGDSQAVVRSWMLPLALVFVDGGHDLDECLADLEGFAPFTDVMAVHDYGMQFTPGVAEAVDSFCDAYGWRIDKIVATLAVLRRTSSR